MTRLRGGVGVRAGSARLAVAVALALPATGCATLWRMGLRPPDGGRRCAPARVDARSAPDGLRLHDQIRVRASEVDFGLTLVTEKQADALVSVAFDGFGAKLFSAVQRGTRIELERAYGRRLPWHAENFLRDVQLARLGAEPPPGVTIERSPGRDGREVVVVRDERCGSETTLAGAGS